MSATGDQQTVARTAVVTGASAGIGAATARALAAAGYRVVVGARRLERLEEIARPIGARVLPLDVSDPESVDAFATALFAGSVDTPRLELLVNNAGFALGLDRVEASRDADWEAVFQTNVLGTLRVTRALLPALRAGGGHLVNVGSIAGFETYPGGASYTASKHALRALTRTLRLELLGEPIRVTDIAPGMVETEFSRVRFQDDPARAESVYQGMQPLTAEDVAECIVWAASRPSHVNIDEIVVRPRDQATATQVHRRLIPG
jgi:NADP-dependent 3-hydroxy acid dehydrogenase YdfG